MTKKADKMTLSSKTGEYFEKIKEMADRHTPKIDYLYAVRTRKHFLLKLQNKEDERKAFYNKHSIPHNDNCNYREQIAQLSEMEEYLGGQEESRSAKVQSTNK
jgi:hypothetical protein